MKTVMYVMMAIALMMLVSCNSRVNMTCGNDICEMGEGEDCPQDCFGNHEDTLEDELDDNTYNNRDFQPEDELTEEEDMLIEDYPISDEETITTRAIDIIDKIPDYKKDFGTYKWNRDSVEPEKCMYLGQTPEGIKMGITGETCFKTTRHEYTDDVSMEIHVNVVKVTSGLDDYLKLISSLATEEMYSGYRLFQTEDDEVAWLSKGDYDLIAVREFDNVPQENGWIAEYGPVAENNPVVMHFLEMIPPDKQMIKDILNDDEEEEEVEVEEEMVKVKEDICVDTDNGLDYDKRAVTSYNGYEYMDHCAIPGNATVMGVNFEFIEGDLLEYACVSEKGVELCSATACRYVLYNCPNGCDDGRCLEK